MITIRLPYTTVPLRSNDRLHWRAKAVQVRAIREVAYLAGRELAERQGPIDWPVVITLVWEVADRRVRDVGASAPTLKAAIDGLVDAGVLLHDRHSIVVEERFRIEVGASKGVRLEIESVERPQDAGQTGSDCARATGSPQIHHRESKSAQSRTDQLSGSLAKVKDGI